ncbi:MAG: phosphatase PAP2 family protein [Clostridia bacterium]|nr:phosphatase PAP2 family protein [Clostridia bacterium]
MFELQILEWINANLHGDKVLNFLFGFVTNSGNAGLIWIALSLIFLIPKNTRKAGFVMLVTLLLSFLLVDVILKPTISRPRPYELSKSIFNFLKTAGIDIPSSPSFPSGHASSAFATSFAMYFQNKKFGKPLVIYGVIVAISRIFFCVHYVSDVITGAVIGFLTAYFIVEIVRKFDRRQISKTGVLKVRDDITF